MHIHRELISPARTLDTEFTIYVYHMWDDTYNNIYNITVTSGHGTGTNIYPSSNIWEKAMK